MFYKISDDQRQQIIREIAEAPAKFTFNAINILGALTKIEEEKVDG